MYNLTSELGLLGWTSTSTLPSPGYSMWNPWKGGWTAEIPEDSMEWGMDSMERGMDSMEWGMDSMERGMDSILLVDGFHTFGGWIPWVFQMDSMVFPHGFHTFSTWIPSFSRWIPYGMSSWNHNSTLIHKFKPKYWVVWNMGKWLNLIT